MAESEVKESTQQPAPAGPAGDESEQLKKLHSDVQSLCDDIDREVDSNMPGRDDLAEISNVLKVIKGRITPTTTTTGGDGDASKDKEQQVLPQSKREELSNLLPTIRRALQQRKQPRSKQDEAHHPAAAETKTKAPSASSCNPFTKARQSERRRRQEEEDDEEAVSLKLLLRLTQNVLEPEQYYEWTTSYVDEDRIYGWQKEADELAAALVAPDGGDGKEGFLFRAAGIAGVHGSGKTALAQKVFVHDKAKDNFALRLWVCVGPPDSEDRFCLLYRMLDNLGLDTAKVEDIVDKSNAVKPHRDAAVERIRNDPAKVAAIRNKANDDMNHKADGEKKPDSDSVKDDDTKTKEEGAVPAKEDGAGEQPPKEQPADDSIFEQLLKEEADESPEVQKSKIGVLLYILHMTLSKTSYMIVFDDIRAYGDDGWYSNLALPPPPEGEWGDRLGYGLPKGNQHRGAVLLTCRNEDHARSMVRTGRVVRPPRLHPDDAWKLFRREYYQAKGQADKFKVDQDDDDDAFLKELKQMKEQIVNKCLGLPVAIAEAAKGFAALQPLPDDDPTHDAEAKTNNKPAAADQTASASNKDTLQPGAEESSKAAATDDD
ncbi:unnamed protein product [Urochloa decumbens]|uniref:NB-ARC domain-containing protein n=1 Tax=Urochloa decumbens TaxID=240449 RepID=A0ABC9GDQ6_9POAL